MATSFLGFRSPQSRSPLPSLPTKPNTVAVDNEAFDRSSPPPSHLAVLFYLRRSRQIRESKVLFFFFLLLLLGDLGGLFSDLPCVQPKWVHPEKSFLKNRCNQRKLFFKMGASKEMFSSKWLHSQKTLAAKLMHLDKTLLQNGCIKSLSFTKFRKIIILSFKVFLNVIKVLQPKVR